MIRKIPTKTQHLKAKIKRLEKELEKEKKKKIEIIHSCDYDGPMVPSSWRDFAQESDPGPIVPSSWRE